MKAKNKNINKYALLVPKTWKLCTNPELIKIWDEAWNEAVKLGYLKAEDKAPLWTFKSCYRWGESRYAKGVPAGIVGVERIFNKSPNSAKETIVHEIAHLCTKGDHHGNKWKKCGDEIGKIYNIKMSRADSAEDLGIDYSLMDYHVRCKHCGYSMHWPEKTVYWAHPEKYYCGCCNNMELERYNINN